MVGLRGGDGAGIGGYKRRAAAGFMILLMREVPGWEFGLKSWPKSWRVLDGGVGGMERRRVRREGMSEREETNVGSGDVLEPGAPRAEGQGLPGQPGQPLPGQPVPGQQVPGQPVPGRPVPGQPLPGQPRAGDQGVIDQGVVEQGVREPRIGEAGIGEPGPGDFVEGAPPGDADDETSDGTAQDTAQDTAQETPEDTAQERGGGLLDEGLTAEDDDLNKLRALVHVHSIAGAAECLRVDEALVAHAVDRTLPMDRDLREAVGREYERARQAGLELELSSLVDGDDGDGAIDLTIEEAHEEADRAELAAAAALPQPVTPGVPPLDRQREQVRLSMWRARSLAISTQFNLDSQYAEHLAALAVIAEIELCLIMYFMDSVPTPGESWDSERRERAMDLRLARLRWVRRQQEHRYTGLRGLWNWAMGQRRVTGKDLYDRMLREADEEMERDVRLVLDQNMEGRAEHFYSGALPPGTLP